MNFPTTTPPKTSPSKPSPSKMNPPAGEDPNTIVVRHTAIVPTQFATVPTQFAPVLDSDPKEAFQYSVDRLRAIQRLHAKAEMHRDSARRHRYDLHRLAQARLLRRFDRRFRFPGVSENVCFTTSGPLGESQGGIGREGRKRTELEGWWGARKGEREPYPRL